MANSSILKSLFLLNYSLFFGFGFPNITRNFYQCGRGEGGLKVINQLWWLSVESFSSFLLMCQTFSCHDKLNCFIKFWCKRKLCNKSLSKAQLINYEIKLIKHQNEFPFKRENEWEEVQNLFSNFYLEIKVNWEQWNDLIKMNLGTNKVQQ